MLSASTPLTRSEIPLSAHSVDLLSAQGPFRTQSNFHIGSWTCFLFLFCLLPQSHFYCVSSAKLVLALVFVAQELPFYHKGSYLQHCQVQFLPVSASPYWVMSMQKIFHLSYNIAVGCDCLVIAIKPSPVAHVVDPT